MNKCIFHGRVTADPKVSYGDSAGKDELHTTYAKFSIAIEDRNWKLENGQYHVDYIPCKAIGKVAEIISSNVYKGKELILSGKMQSGSYEKDGKKVYTLDLLVQEIEFCGKKEAQPEQCSGEFMNIPEGIDEELPFK